MKNWIFCGKLPTFTHKTMESRAKNNDEVDIGQFFRWVGNGFSRLGNSFVYFLAILRREFFFHKFFFGVIIIVGLIIGGVYSELLKKKFYKTTMVLSCDYLNTQILNNTIDKLNLLCQEPAREGLAEVLGIDIITAKNILQFEFSPFVSEDDIVEMEVLRTQLNNVASDKKEIVDKVIDKLEIENKNAYQISIWVYDPEIVKPLEKSLVSFFSGNTYVKRRIEINKTNLTNRKSKLVRESKKLDSLKQVILKSFANGSKGAISVVLSEERLNQPLDVFKEDLRINNEILDIDKSLYLQKDFEVVDGFTTFKSPESAGLVSILFISFWISLLIGYLLLGLWNFDRMLANYPISEN